MDFANKLALSPRQLQTYAMYVHYGESPVRALEYVVAFLKRNEATGIGLICDNGTVTVHFQTVKIVDERDELENQSGPFAVALSLKNST
jgi:hypothetical protein